MGRKPTPPSMPLSLLLLLLPLLAHLHSGLGLQGPAGPGSRQLSQRRILDLRSSIVQALGLAGVPDLAKANVSQAEYERAHQEYLSKVQPNAAGQRSSLVALRPSGVEVEGAEIRLTFATAQQQQQQQLAGNCSLESQLLRLLPRADVEQPLELRVYEESGGWALLARGRLVAGPQRWLELELRGGPGPLGRLRLLLVDAATGARWTRGWAVSEAALNLQLSCRPTASRSRRSARRDRGPWSAHKGRRSECRGAANKRCCRHEMAVDFQQLEGFEFIVQPKSFDAGFCKGRCPPRYNPAHHHALLQSLIWKGDRSKAPRPCCAPSKLAELEILYFDENEPSKLKVSSWKDMRVLECACS